MIFNRKLTSRKVRATSAHPYLLHTSRGLHERAAALYNGGINSAETGLPRCWHGSDCYTRQSEESLGFPQRINSPETRTHPAKQQQQKTSPSKAGVTSLWHQGHTIVSVYYQVNTMSSLPAHLVLKTVTNQCTTVFG